jgi:hypothetical protein
MYLSNCSYCNGIYVKIERTYHLFCSGECKYSYILNRRNRINRRGIFYDQILGSTNSTSKPIIITK